MLSQIQCETREKFYASSTCSKLLTLLKDWTRNTRLGDIDILIDILIFYTVQRDKLFLKLRVCIVVYRMVFLGRNFASGLLCTLNSKKTQKPLTN